MEGEEFSGATASRGTVKFSRTKGGEITGSVVVCVGDTMNEIDEAYIIALRYIEKIIQEADRLS